MFCCFFPGAPFAVGKRGVYLVLTPGDLASMLSYHSIAAIHLIELRSVVIELSKPG